jgi:hypothetical protein
MKFEARIEGENIIIPKDKFRYMVNCWKYQKDIHKLGGNLQADLQKKMDKYYKQAEKLLKNDRQ